jgi:multimeric flavodoxin WrbA
VTGLEKIIRARSHALEVLEVARGDLVFCFGCLRCWSSGSSVYVSRDRMPEIEAKLPGCDQIICMTPVLFGTFSPMIRTFIEKGFGCCGSCGSSARRRV